MYRERRTVVILASFIVILFFAAFLVSPSFLSPTNLTIVAVNASYVAIASLGMFMVILSGQIDVSVGAMLAIASTLAGFLGQYGIPLPIVVVLVVAFGTLLGLINALIVVGFRMHSIVATLGTLSIFRGALISVTGGQWIRVPPKLQALSQGTILDIPYGVIITVAVALLVYWFLGYMDGGRRLYAYGSNPESARLVGMNVKRLQAAPFLLNGALVALAGVVLASQFDNVQSNSGQGFELTAISAVVVGGANIFGGTGSVAGSLLGALLVSVLGTILIFFHVSAYWEEALQGLIILVAVSLYTIRRKTPTRQAASGQDAARGNLNA